MKSRILFVLRGLFVMMYIISVAIIVQFDFPQWIGYLLFIVGAICFWFLCLNAKCPCCHRLGLRPRIYWKNAGFCHHCGEQVFWKEYQD